MHLETCAISWTIWLLCKSGLENGVCHFLKSNFPSFSRARTDTQYMISSWHEVTCSFSPATHCELSHAAKRDFPRDSWAIPALCNALSYCRIPPLPRWAATPFVARVKWKESGHSLQQRYPCSRGWKPVQSWAHNSCLRLQAKAGSVLPWQGIWLSFASMPSQRDYQHQPTFDRRFQNNSVDFSSKNSWSWYRWLTLTWSTTNVQMVLSLPYMFAEEVKGTDSLPWCVWKPH